MSAAFMAAVIAVRSIHPYHGHLPCYCCEILLTCSGSLVQPDAAYTAACMSSLYRRQSLPVDRDKQLMSDQLASHAQQL